MKYSVIGNQIKRGLEKNADEVWNIQEEYVRALLKERYVWFVQPVDLNLYFYVLAEYMYVKDAKWFLMKMARKWMVFKASDY